MIDSGKRISVEELRVGMFVADVFNAKDVLLYSARTLITNEKQISSLKQHGVTTVAVVFDDDAAYASDTVSTHHDEEAYDEKDVPPGESVIAYASYQQQMKDAGEIRGQTIETVREAMGAVRMGRIFSARKVVRSTESLVEKVLDDPDVYFGLSQIKSHSNHAYVHSVNVSIVAAAFAAALKYSSSQILDIAVGGMLHDIGKMKIPEPLWFKSESCTRKEYEVFKQHPLLGVEIIQGNQQKIPELSKLIIAQHHERWSGGGYPAGRTGQEINETALMCSLADCYDLLTTKTPYRRASIPQEALATIFQKVDEEYPRTLVEQFTRLLGIFPVGSFVKFKSGEKGIVIRVHRNNLLAPVALILFNGAGRRVSKPFVRDLALGSSHRSDYPHYKIECSIDPQLDHVNLSHFFQAIAG
jgi:putative nucleotidyltransferase with HDIG domain